MEVGAKRATGDVNCAVGERIYTSRPSAGIRRFGPRRLDTPATGRAKQRDTHICCVSVVCNSCCCCFGVSRVVGTNARSAANRSHCCQQQAPPHCDPHEAMHWDAAMLCIFGMLSVTRATWKEQQRSDCCCASAHGRHTQHTRG